tara:strand:- start:1358 stop:2290 length:933 start_codon:yes stop_codon:yes gene_type:complete
MATTTNVSSNYAGSVAGGIIGAAFKEGSTLSLGVLTVAENVNFKMNLRKIAYADGTVNYSCGHAPAGTITLSEKVIEPKKVKNDFTVCKEDFRQTWSDDSMGASASNVNAPSDIMEAIQLELLSSQAAKVDDDIWNGLNATAGEIGDGFIPQFSADGSVIKANNGITALGAATTESNVEAHLKAALNAIPVSLRRKEVEVLVSSNVFQAYTFFLISKGIAWNGTADDKMAKFGRYNLVEIQGLPDDTIICAEQKNLVFATGLNSDFNTVALEDEDAIGLLTGNVRGKIVYAAGVGYYNSNEIVWLLTTTV